MAGKRISFKLFVRPGAPASDAARGALTDYCRSLSDVDLQIVDLTDAPDVAAAESIVIVPTLKVRAAGASKLFVTGLAPLDLLRRTLKDLLS